MTITIDATYEDGVLKPSHPLPLREHETVRLTVEPHGDRAAAIQLGENALVPPGPLLGEHIAGLACDLPADVLDALPVDGASQHDHYIYGTPKRPERR